MKRLKYILLVGLLLSNLTAWGQYDPPNPPEPAGSLRISLVAEPAEAGYFNCEKEVAVTEGESYYLYAYSRGDYRFVAWEQDGKVISTSPGFNYLMGSTDVTLTARFVYSPPNPPEPVIRHQLFLESDPVGAGSFNWSSGSTFAEGEQLYLRAYGNNGYKLAYWYRIEGADTLKLSTNASLDFTMGKEDVALKAKFVFDPYNPGEPSTPDEKYYYIQGYSTSVEQGGTVDFPVYLVNSGNVSGLAFDLIPDNNIVIDKEKVTLGNRCNTHTLQITENEEGNSWHFVISGEQNIQGTSGAILNIPLTVSSEVKPGYYNIQFANAVVKLPNGIEKVLTTYDAELYVNLASKKMGAEDYAALCDMYNEMKGTNWSVSWDISSDMIDGSNWRGVTFTDNHVSAIELSACRVSGSIPSSVLALPTLEKLNLSSNALDWNVKELAEILAKHSIRPILSELILNGNQLKGDVSVLANAFPALKTLKLQNNCFSELSAPLSDEIENLNIRYQQVPVEEIPEIRLAVKTNLYLPTIFTYSHSTKSYKPVSSLGLSLNQSGVTTTATLYNKTEYYEMSWSDWRAASGSQFLLESRNNDATGSTLPVIVFFDKGDVNADSAIDVLDVQGTLNYIVNGSSYLFVYAAADVYEDSKLTVQDIVLLVDLVLGTPVLETASVVAMSSFARSQMLSSVRICIEDGKLVMYSDGEVAAADIVLSGCRPSQLRMLLNVSQYQTAMKEKDDAVRLIVYSIAGETIPAGRTVLAELSSQEAAVVYVDLADKDARRISAVVSPTSVHADISEKVSIYNVNNHVCVTLPLGVERMTVDAIGMDGCPVGKKVFETPAAGALQVMSDFVPGIYLIRLQLETSEGITYKSQKVVISK